MKRKTGTAIVALLGAAVLFGGRAAAQPGPGTGYPYVKSGTNIIVNRDKYGGVRTKGLISQRTKTYSTLGGDVNAKLPAQFEVKSEKGYFNLAQAKNCGAGWRIPTYREVLLIMLLNDDLQTKIPTNVWIWTDTGDNNEKDTRYQCRFGAEGYIETGRQASQTANVLGRICVRDIAVPELGLSDL